MGDTHWWWGWVSPGELCITTW